MVTIEHHKIVPEIFNNQIFGFQLKAMRLYGFIIGTNQRYQLWHFIRCTFFTISLVLFALLNSIRVLQNIHILEMDFILRPTTMANTAYAVHIVNAYFQRKRVVRLVTAIHEVLLYIRSGSDALEEELFNKTTKYLRRISYLFVFPSIVQGCLGCLEYLILTFLHPDEVYNQIFLNEKLNGTTKSLLLIESYPFGKVEDNYIIAYVGPYFSIMLSVCAHSITHTFSTCLLKYLIFKVEIINKRISEMDLTKLASNSKKDINQLNENEKNVLRLKVCEDCVKEQIKLRWFVLELQQLLRIPLFMDFFILSVLLCVLLYLIVFVNLTSFEYVFATVFISAMSGYQLLYHWHATILTKNHEAMCAAIYSSDWYNYSLKVQKSIHILMMDSKKPLVMTAIFIELKLETVLEIFRGAISYFSILRNLNV